MNPPAGGLSSSPSRVACSPASRSRRPAGGARRSSASPCCTWPCAATAPAGTPWSGFVWGLAFFLPLITWADEAVGLVPWLALSTLEAAYFALFGAAWTLGAPRATRSGAASACRWSSSRSCSSRPRSSPPPGRSAASRGAGSRSPRRTRRSPRSPRLGGTPLLTGAVVAVGVLLARIMLAARRLRARSPGRRDAPSSAVVLVVGPADPARHPGADRRRCASAPCRATSRAPGSTRSGSGRPC